MQTEGQITMQGTPLDEKTTRLLEALQALGPGWHSRMDIARQLNKPKLNPVEIVALDMLATTGVIERAMHTKADQPQINQWEYRQKG